MLYVRAILSSITLIHTKFQMFIIITAYVLLENDVSIKNVRFTYNNNLYKYSNNVGNIVILLFLLLIDFCYNFVLQFIGRHNEDIFLSHFSQHKRTVGIH